MSFNKNNGDIITYVLDMSGHGTHSVFELLDLVGCEAISFCNEWNDVDFLMQSLHELHVHRAQSGGEKRKSKQLCVKIYKMRLP